MNHSLPLAVEGLAEPTLRVGSGNIPVMLWLPRGEQAAGSTKRQADLPTPHCAQVPDSSRLRARTESHSSDPENALPLLFFFPSI